MEAFEPLPSARELLVANVAANGIGGAVRVNFKSNEYQHFNETRVRRQGCLTTWLAAARISAPHLAVAWGLSQVLRAAGNTPATRAPPLFLAWYPLGRETGLTKQQGIQMAGLRDLAADQLSHRGGCICVPTAVPRGRFLHAHTAPPPHTKGLPVLTRGALLHGVSPHTPLRGCTGVGVAVVAPRSCRGQTWHTLGATVPK